MSWRTAEKLTDGRVLAAGILNAPELRSLDAIHLAAAQELGRDVRVIVTYDARMASAAKQLGYRVVQPR